MESDTATATTEAPDSVNDSARATATADTNTDTGTTEVHTAAETAPASDDSEAHIQWLRENSDKIPTEKLSFLDKKFQPDYTSKVNKLNLLRDDLTTKANKIGENLGVKVPDGKSVFDLMTEGDGSAFLDVVNETVKNNLKPIMDQVEAGRLNETLRRQIGVATQHFPLVKEHYAEVIQAVDSDNDLSQMAMFENGRALPYILDYAALRIETAKLRATVADQAKKLDMARVASKGTSTSKATGGKPPTAPTTTGGSMQSVIRAAAEAAFEDMQNTR